MIGPAWQTLRGAEEEPCHSVMADAMMLELTCLSSTEVDVVEVGAFKLWRMSIGSKIISKSRMAQGESVILIWCQLGLHISGLVVSEKAKDA